MAAYNTELRANPEPTTTSNAVSLSAMEPSRSSPTAFLNFGAPWWAMKLLMSKETNMNTAPPAAPTDDSVSGSPSAAAVAGAGVAAAAAASGGSPAKKAPAGVVYDPSRSLAAITPAVSNVERTPTTEVHSMARKSSCRQAGYNTPAETAATTTARNVASSPGEGEIPARPSCATIMSPKIMAKLTQPPRQFAATTAATMAALPPPVERSKASAKETLRVAAAERATAR
mmetsp:Transcript_145575/g.363056  ORF Transcript_145575/g.363056 Transcript_145575/m.363056 type:complete len:229 (+) Transcript_145575:591-1277(+)